MLSFDLSRIGAVDHRRLIDDLVGTAGFLKSLRSLGRNTPWPHAILRQIGADILHAAPGDHGARSLRDDPATTIALSRDIYERAFNGCVPVPLLLAATILGRFDLYDRFCVEGRFSIELGLHWLVMHGLAEHGLWHFLTDPFVRGLQSRHPQWQGGTMSPLDSLLLLERPELAAEAGERGVAIGDGLSAWLLRAGVDEYNLQWVLKDADFLRYALGRSPISMPSGMLTEITDAYRPMIGEAEDRRALRDDMPLKFDFSIASFANQSMLGPYMRTQRGAGLCSDRVDFVLPVLSGRVRGIVVELVGLEGDTGHVALSVDGVEGGSRDLGRSPSLVLYASLHEASRANTLHVVTIARGSDGDTTSPPMWGTLSRAWTI